MTSVEVLIRRQHDLEAAIKSHGDRFEVLSQQVHPHPFGLTVRPAALSTKSTSMPPLPMLGCRKFSTGLQIWWSHNVRGMQSC